MPLRARHTEQTVAGSARSMIETDKPNTLRAFSVPSRLSHLASLVEQRLNIEPSDEHEKAFFGEGSVNPHEEKRVLSSIYHQARQAYYAVDSEQALMPSSEARMRTKAAAVEFYRLAYEMTGVGEKFPLFGKNKCIGFVAIPNSKLVVVAVSQDRVPANDVSLRRVMVELMDRMNKESSNPYVFQLAALPTQEQYLIFRALSTPNTYDGLPSDLSDEVLQGTFDSNEYDKCGDCSTQSRWASKFVEYHSSDASSDSASASFCDSDSDTPHPMALPTFESDIHRGIPRALVFYRTRCVEASLMVALNKIGRTNDFSAQDVSMEAFSCGLWSNPVTQEHIADKETNYKADMFGKAIDGFGAASRNAKYTIEPSLEVELRSGQKAYLDYWGPCNLHCQQLLKNMRAVSVVGGAGSSFLGPIFDMSPLKPFELDHLPSRSKSNFLTQYNQVATGGAIASNVEDVAKDSPASSRHGHQRR